jgi:predicted nucleotidyltransferase
MTEELQSAVDSAVEALTSALNPKQIYLFGSCARGTAVDGSDIDLLVVVEDGSGPIPVKHIERRVSSTYPKIS